MAGQGDFRTGDVGSSEAANEEQGDDDHNSTATPTDKRIGVPNLLIQRRREGDRGLTGQRDFMYLRVMNGSQMFPA